MGSFSSHRSFTLIYTSSGDRNESTCNTSDSIRPFRTLRSQSLSELRSDRRAFHRDRSSVGELPCICRAQDFERREILRSRSQQVLLRSLLPGHERLDRVRFRRIEDQSGEVRPERRGRFPVLALHIVREELVRLRPYFV